MDSFDILEWISRQPWSDGQIVGIGNSFSGTTAELLLATEHPAVKAIVPQFNHPDPFTDIAFPGGILSERFIRAWGEMDINLDLNKPPSAYGNLMNIFIQECVRLEIFMDAQTWPRRSGCTAIMASCMGCPADRISRSGASIGYSPDDSASILYAETIRGAQYPYMVGPVGWTLAPVKPQCALFDLCRPSAGGDRRLGHGGFINASPYLPKMRRCRCADRSNNMTSCASSVNGSSQTRRAA